MVASSASSVADGIAVWNSSHAESGSPTRMHLCVASASVSDPDGAAQAALETLLAAQKAHGVESAEFQQAFAAAPPTAAVSFLNVARKSAQFDPTSADGFTPARSQAYLNAVVANAGLFNTQVSISSTAWTAQGLSQEDAISRIESPWPNSAKISKAAYDATAGLLGDLAKSAKALDGSLTPTATLSIALQNLTSKGVLSVYFAFFTLTAINKKPHRWSPGRTLQFTVGLTSGGVYDIAFLSGNWTPDIVKQVVHAPFTVPTFADWVGANSGEAS